MEKEDALKQIEIIKAVVAENKKIIPRSSPYLILWGIISIVGFGLEPYLKNWSGLFWVLAGIGGGFLSGLIGRREELVTGKYTSLVGRQIALIFLSMFVCGWALTSVFILALSDKITDTSLGLLISIGWIAVISMAWFITGVLSNFTPYMTVPATTLLLSATVAIIFVPQLFYYVTAVVGGGGMLISGILAGAKSK